MSSLNKVMLIGNLGRDPEIRSTQDGKRVANLSIATSDRWRDKHSGEQRERTEWHRVVVFNQHLVDIVERYVHKGSKIYLEGKLQTRKWTDNAGVEKYTTEIVLTDFEGQVKMLSGRQSNDNGGEDRSQGSGDPSTQCRPVGGHSDLDDDIPF